MVSFSDVAVFILATTRTNGRYKQDYPTYFESRIVPIRETWGQYFSQLYFVFGTNKYDHDFLTQQCRPETSTGGKESRRLAVSKSQVPLEDTRTLYSCPVYELDSHYLSREASSNDTLRHPTVNKQHSMLYDFNALWTGNCTGDYFGVGPTCRCQEAMRYFLHEPSMQKNEWFIFIDDDILFRPFSLLAMLTELTNKAKGAQFSNNSDSTQENSIALVGPTKYRGFDFSKRGIRDDSSESHKCRNSTAFEFAFAQPAIINRAAMQHMGNSINANALTGLQKLWGGTHDAILGMLLWKYAIPTYSLNSTYQGGAFFVENGHVVKGKGKFKNNFDVNQHFIFHRLSNFKVYAWVHEEKKYYYKFALAGQYDIVKLLEDEVLYTSKHRGACMQHPHNCSDAPLAAKIATQQKLGRRGYQNLTPMHASMINMTVFAPKAREIHKQFEYFRPADCVLLS